MTMSNPLFQVTGLVSGIDWGTMIDKIMERERKIADVWTSEKEKLEFRIDLYNEFSANFKTLRSTLTHLSCLPLIWQKLQRLLTLAAL